MGLNNALTLLYLPASLLYLQTENMLALNITNPIPSNITVEASGIGTTGLGYSVGVVVGDGVYCTSDTLLRECLRTYG